MARRKAAARVLFVNASLGMPQCSDVIKLLGATGNQRGIALHCAPPKHGSETRAATGAVRALARSQAGAEALWKLAKNNQLAPDFIALSSTALRMVSYPALKADINQLFPAPAALGGKPLPPIVELVKRSSAAKNEEVVLAMPGGATNKVRKGDIAKREKLQLSMISSNTWPLKAE